MTVLKKWSGDGAGTGDLSTSTVGTGDNAFDFVTKTGDAAVFREAGTSPGGRPFASASIVSQPKTAGQIASFGWSFSATNTYSFRFYVGILGEGLVSTPLVCGKLNGEIVWRLFRGSFGRMYLYDGINYLYDSSTYNALPLNTWHNIRVRTEPTSFTAQSNLQSGSYATGTSMIDSPIDTIEFGAVESSTIANLRFDDFELRDTADFIEPWAPSGTPPTPDTWSIIEDGVEIPVTYEGVSTGLDIDTRAIDFMGIEDGSGLMASPPLGNVIGVD